MVPRRKKRSAWRSWILDRDNAQTDKQDIPFAQKTEASFKVLQNFLESKECDIMESIITNSIDDPRGLNYETWKESINKLHEELDQYLDEAGIDADVSIQVKHNYISYIKSRMLLKLPENKIDNVLFVYHSKFLPQIDHIRERIREENYRIKDSISDIALFSILVKCNTQERSWIRRFLSIINTVEQKKQQELLLEKTNWELVTSLIKSDPKQELINNLWPDRMDAFESIMTENLPFISPALELIIRSINTFDEKYNLLLSTDEKDVLEQIWWDIHDKIKNWD